jgi:NADP-dependent 3-hydroxy acid dehydrogenase YdfG
MRYRDAHSWIEEGTQAMHDKEAAHADKPLAIITGASGGVGTALPQGFNDDYRIIALDRNEAEQANESHEFGLTDAASLK